jgi:hypothetical protein
MAEQIGADVAQTFKRKQTPSRIPKGWRGRP